MVAHRSASMAVLDGQIKALHPGVVVGWIRTAPGAPSDHYPDDTPGLPAAQSDADTEQEVRALDAMLGPAFGADDAETLVDNLTTIPANQGRLLYVIWDREIWYPETGWRRYGGTDPHTNHVHISGDARDDANTAPWAIGGDMATPREVWEVDYRDPVPDDTGRRPIRDTGDYLLIIRKDALDAARFAATAATREIGIDPDTVDAAVRSVFTDPDVVKVYAEAIAAELAERLSS